MLPKVSAWTWSIPCPWPPEQLCNKEVGMTFISSAGSQFAGETLHPTSELAGEKDFQPAPDSRGQSRAGGTAVILCSPAVGVWAHGRSRAHK